MGRALRSDGPGRWYHVINRGIARRTVFRSRAEIRYFLAEVARAVRRGEIEVHAFAVLTTHFHLLVRSPRGALSEAMRRIENGFVRWFNRRQRRDGALFRGRFVSCPVESEEHWLAVVRYIDRNPVEARLSGRAEDYPNGSAWHFARRPGPRWLARGEVEEQVRLWSNLPSFDARHYGGFSRDTDPAEVDWIVERRLASTRRSSDELDDLLSMAPAQVRTWMERKARLADGRPVSACFVSPERVVEAVRTLRSRDRQPAEGTARRARDPWRLVTVGLLSQASGLSNKEIARRLDLDESTTSRHLRAHFERVVDDVQHCERSAEALKLALHGAYR